MCSAFILSFDVAFSSSSQIFLSTFDVMSFREARKLKKFRVRTSNLYLDALSSACLPP